MTARPTPAHRYVVHLPILATDLPRARRLAASLGRLLSRLSTVDTGEITVSAEDDQSVHHRVFCDTRLGGSARRCARRADHDGPCTARLTHPSPPRPARRS